MTPRKRTNAYWAKRSQEQLTLVEKQALPQLKAVDKVFRNAQKTNLASIKNLYVNYYGKQGFDISALKQLAPKGDVRRFKQAVEALGLSSRLPDGYGYRLTRYELLEGQMWLEIHKVGIAQARIQNSAFAKTLETAYYHTAYAVAKATGISPAFSTIDTKLVNRILGKKFAGKTFSARIWRNTDKLAKELNGILAEATINGHGYAKTARLVRERYGVKRYEAQRLVQTETARFNFDGSQEMYRDIGLEQWVYVATLDRKTDLDCSVHDGKIFPLGGGPQIPIHSNCRCAPRSFVGKAYEPDERIMRDPKTGRNSYVGNITFQEWSAKVGL